MIACPTCGGSGSTREWYDTGEVGHNGHRKLGHRPHRCLVCLGAGQVRGLCALCQEPLRDRDIGAVCGDCEHDVEGGWVPKSALPELEETRRRLLDRWNTRLTAKHFELWWYRKNYSPRRLRRANEYQRRADAVWDLVLEVDELLATLRAAA